MSEPTDPGTTNNLPTLPVGMRPGTACLWAANIVSAVAMREGYPGTEVRKFLLQLAMQFGPRIPEAELMAECLEVARLVRLLETKGTAQ